MSILLFGAHGQVGARIAQQAECIALSRNDADFMALDIAAVEKLIDRHQPTHIINAAGFTAVDAAETQSETAYAVNAAAPKTIAQAAAGHGIPFFHFSTDYVFDGVNGAPYAEDARVNPLNHYGKSKLYGEQAALDAGGRVFRLQWVFDTRGSNFYLSMRRLLAERATLNVVADQLGAPSHARHIARAVLQSLALPAGLYHLAPQGYTSWHGFACAIAAGMKSNCAIAPITSAEYPLPATRPRDTRLNTSKLTAHGITLPHWRDGLQEALDETH